ncbi:hypothetical protein Vretifemale_20754, partial [Volvox reticuliferus]
ERSPPGPQPLSRAALPTRLTRVPTSQAATPASQMAAPMSRERPRREDPGQERSLKRRSRERSPRPHGQRQVSRERAPVARPPREEHHHHGWRPSRTGSGSPVRQARPERSSQGGPAAPQPGLVTARELLPPPTAAPAVSLQPCHHPAQLHGVGRRAYHMPRLHCGHGLGRVAFFVQRDNQYTPAAVVAIDTGFTGAFTFSRAFLDRHRLPYDIPGAPELRTFDGSLIPAWAHVTGFNLLIEMEHDQAILIPCPDVVQGDLAWPVIHGQEADIVVGMAFLEGRAQLDLEAVDSDHRYLTLTKIVLRAAHWRLETFTTYDLAYAGVDVAPTTAAMGTLDQIEPGLADFLMEACGGDVEAATKCYYEGQDAEVEAMRRRRTASRRWRRKAHRQVLHAQEQALCREEEWRLGQERLYRQLRQALCAKRHQRPAPQPVPRTWGAPPCSWSGRLLLLAVLLLSLCATHVHAGGSPPFHPPAEGFQGHRGARPAINLEPGRSAHSKSPTRRHTSPSLLDHTAWVLAGQWAPGVVASNPPTSGASTNPVPSVGRPRVAPGSLAPEPSRPSMTTPEGNRYPGTGTTFVKDDKGGYLWCERPDMDPMLKAKFKQMLAKHDAIFARSLKDLGCYSGAMGPATIDLVHDRPIWQPQRHHSPLELKIQEEKCAELRDAGIIVPSASTKYAMNVTMPAKKDANGQWTDRRYCCDARPLNAATKPNRYAPPTPEQLFQRIGDATWLSKMDCRAAFNQIPLAEADQDKTSFWWNGKLWKYTRNLYGLRNATGQFQMVIDHELRRCGLDHCAMAFVDDILVFSPTAEQHLQDCAAVFACLQQCGLKLHPDKTIIAAEEVEFLGHMVSAQGLRPMDAKISAILALQPPKNLTELQALLGLANYYRGYVPKFSELAAPLNELTRKGVLWNEDTWQDRHQAVLDALKDCFRQEGLIVRRVRPNRLLILHTDFSTYGISGVLGQLDDDGQEYMVAAVSRSLNSHERNYISYKGEMLAACWAMQTLRPYLHGVPFVLVTDHAPLLWLMEGNTIGSTGTYARWALIMSQFDFDVCHRPGALHQNADALSRIPLPAAHDGTGARMDQDSDPKPPGPRLVPYPTALVTGEAYRFGSVAQVALVAAAARLQRLRAAQRCTHTMLPTSEELLAGHNGLVMDAVDKCPLDNPSNAQVL